MLARSLLGLLLLGLAACGGEAGEQSVDPGLFVTAGTGSGGAGASTSGQGGDVAAAGSAPATAGSTGSAGEAPTSGAGGTESSSAGQPGGAGAGNLSGGAPQGGHAGTPQGGSAGQASDPLAPKPAANCPGYVDILVPENTCVWIHGSFTSQSPTCGIVDPNDSECATVTALPMDSQGNFGPQSARVSSGALFERFELPINSSACPMQCN